MKLRKKIEFSFFAATVIPMGILMLVFYTGARNSLRDRIYQHLKTTAQAKAHLINSYFAERKRDIDVLAKMPHVAEDLGKLEQALAASGMDIASFVGTSEHGEVVKSLDAYLKNYKEQHGYYDTFLIDHSGNIVCTVVHEADYGTNILDGPYKDSSLGKAVASAKRKQGLAFGDYEHYAPSDEPAAFFANVVLDHEENLHGYVALQLPVDKINEIMQDRTGLGETGETYLVGQDYLMRSDSRFFDESTILKQRVDTMGSRMFIGEHLPEAGLSPMEPKPTVYKDYRGIDVLGVHVFIPEVQWGLLAEIDAKEAFAPLARLKLFFLITLFASLSIVYITSILIAKAVTAPILLLQKGTEIIGSGNLDYKVGTEVKDEIGDLSRAFDKMAENLKTTTASRDEFDATNQQLRAAEQQLMAANQQLHANGQQLKAANQQLSANGQQLKAANQQLTAGEQQLKAANQQLMASDQQLRAANQQLTATNQQLEALNRELVESQKEISALARFPAENPYPVIRVTKDGTIVYANNGSDCLLANWACQVGGQLPRKWRQLASDVLDCGQSKEVDVEYDCCSLSLTFAPIKDLDYVNIYGLDITQRRKAEEQLRQTRANLEHTARLITAGEMASGLAHELNQPLCAILNYANACLRGIRTKRIEQDQLTEILNDIAGQADRAGEIIRRLRSLIRKREPKQSAVNINKIVEDVIKLEHAEALEQGIELFTELAEDIQSVIADDVQVQQVVLNLVRNGFEAMTQTPREKRRLTVRTTAIDGDKIEIAVCDSGRGLSKDTAEKMFDSFFSTRAEGLGVGLSLSRSIVEAHHGKIWAKPNTDCGATVRFTLPVKGAKNG